MPAYSVRALVLRKTKLGETDTILTLLAEDGRQVRAVAKGMRKPGSRLSGRLEPFAVADLLLYKGRSLDVITEAETLEPHSALREDYDRTIAASVVADVLDKIAVEGQSEPRLFGLALATFSAMEQAAPESLQALVTAFLIKSMAMHGLKPELDSCAACAAEATGGSRFSLAAGGVLCPACGDASAVDFSDEGRVLLLEMLAAKMEAVSSIDADARASAEAFGLVRSFVVYHLPARLKALDIYSGGA